MAQEAPTMSSHRPRHPAIRPASSALQSRMLLYARCAVISAAKSTVSELLAQDMETETEGRLSCNLQRSVTTERASRSKIVSAMESSSPSVRTAKWDMR